MTWMSCHEKRSVEDRQDHLIFYEKIQVVVEKEAEWLSCG